MRRSTWCCVSLESPLIGRAAGRRRRNRRQLGPFLSAIENRDRFPAVDGAKHVLHVVAKIDYGCVHGVSLYKYTFRQNARRRFLPINRRRRYGAVEKF